MSDTPAVSIIIATYNRAPVLRLALESVRRQTFADWEALAIGDGCTDGSAEMVAGMTDPRFHWHNLPENSGSQAVPNNTGLAMARGRWVAYLGHDDLWFPWHLQELVAVSEAEVADFAHSLAAYFTESGLGGCWGAPAEGTTYAMHQMPPSGWLHDRDLVLRHGGWADSRTLDMPVDLHLSRRMAQAGARFAFQPRLSVLKFPAPYFPGAYRNAQTPPQAALLRAMILDAEGLEKSLLQQLANDHARLLLRGAIPMYEAFLAGGGSPKSVARYQEQRQASRRQSGLEGELETPPTAAPEMRQVGLDHLGGGARARGQHDGASALWIRCSGATPDSYVLLDGTPLESAVRSPELVTAIVPEALTRRPGTKSLVLVNRGGVSRSEALVMHAPGGVSPLTWEYAIVVWAGDGGDDERRVRFSHREDWSEIGGGEYLQTLRRLGDDGFELVTHQFLVRGHYDRGGLYGQVNVEVLTFKRPTERQGASS